MRGAAPPSLPLLVRRPLEPGESLYSYLIQLARLNRYPLTGLLALFLPYEVEIGRRLDNAFYPKRPQTYERLADLTRLSPCELYRSTPHRFASLLALSRQTVKTITIPGCGVQPALTDQRPYMLRNERQAQFCPDCLQESAYHRLIWTPVLVLVCLRHRCLLASRCPGCGREVLLASVVAARCRQCGAALTSAWVDPMRDDPFGLFVQRTLQAWLEDRAAPANAWAASMPPQPPATLYYLATRLLTAILDNLYPGGNWKTQRLCAELTSGELLPVWTWAFRALVGWPEGFYQFWETQTLEGLLHDSRPAVAGLTGSFRFHLGLLSGQKLAFTHVPLAGLNPDVRWRRPSRRQRAAEAARDHLRQLAPFPHVTIRAAARALGAPQVVVERLIVTGQLVGNLALSEVQRTDVLKLCQRWQQPLTLAEACTWTGLAPAYLQGLIETQGARLVRDSVCEFMLTMAERLRPKPTWPRRPADASQDEETLNLTESEALARQFGFVAADLFVLVLKGRLRGCPQASPPDLGAIRFPASALRLLLRRRRPQGRA